jgi:hypothetical protein
MPSPSPSPSPLTAIDYRAPQGIASASTDGIYAAMDWLGRPDLIEVKLAAPAPAPTLVQTQHLRKPPPLSARAGGCLASTACVSRPYSNDWPDDEICQSQRTRWRFGRVGYGL